MEREKLEKQKKKAELEKAEKDKSDKVKLFPSLEYEWKTIPYSIFQFLPNSMRR